MFYEIDEEFEPNVIGVKDGLHQIELNKNAFETKAEHDLFMDFFDCIKYFQRENPIPNFEINILKATLRKSAKVTDFMTFVTKTTVIVNPYYIISEKAHQIIRTLNIPDNYFYPVMIWNKEAKFEQSFYLWYVPFITRRKIDFPNSTINTGTHATGYQKFNLGSYEELIEFKKKYGLSYFDNFTYLDKEICNQDFVHSRATGDFISEKFKQLIEQNNLTGLRIRNNNKLRCGAYRVVSVGALA